MLSRELSIPLAVTRHAAMALAHCGCGQAQRSFRPLPSAASEQAWLQYFSPAETGHVQLGWAQRFSIASAITILLFYLFLGDFGFNGSSMQGSKLTETQRNQNACRTGSNPSYIGPPARSLSNLGKSHLTLTIQSTGSTISYPRGKPESAVSYRCR